MNFETYCRWEEMEVERQQERLRELSGGWVCVLCEDVFPASAPASGHPSRDPGDRFCGDCIRDLGIPPKRDIKDFMSGVWRTAL